MRASLRNTFILVAGFIFITGLVAFSALKRHEQANRAPLEYKASTGVVENRFTLRLKTGVLELRDDQSGALLRSQRLERTSAVIIKGADGQIDDTLTVDFGDGMFSLPEGIRFDGGEGGFDTLALCGGQVTNQRYDMSSASDGIVTLDEMRVTFTNLEPMNDTTVAASLTINGTVGADAITIADGGLVNGFQTTRVSSGGTFESVSFANKAAVTVDGNGGGDVVMINNPNPAVGMTTLVLLGIQTISQSGPLKVANFGFVAGGPVLLGNVNNDVDMLSGRVTPAGAISFADVDDLTTASFAFSHLQADNGNITLMTGGALTLNASLLCPNSILTLNSGGPVTQGATIFTQIAGGQVRFIGAGPFTLENSFNIVPVFAASTTGSISLKSTNGLAGMTIGNVAGTPGVVSNSHPIAITALSPLTVTDTRSGADVDAGTSTVSLTAGRAANDDSLTINPNADVTGTGGALLLKADNMSIGAPVATGNFALHLEPFEAGTPISLGGPDGSNRLGITDAEIDMLTAGAIAIGSTVSGAINVISAISPAHTMQLLLQGAAGFTSNGGSLSEDAITLVDWGSTERTWDVTPTNITATPGNPIPYNGVALLGFNLGSGSDIVNIIPSATTVINLGGGDPVPPVTPGDALNLSLAGTTNPFFTSTGNGKGTYTFSNRQSVSFVNIETLLSGVDLSLSKTDGQTEVQPGANLSYVIIAKNNGSLGLNSVPVADTLPPALANASWTCSASPGSGCGAASGLGNINQQISLAAGGTVTYNVSATVASSATGIITNTANVALPPGVGDPNLSNNSATDTTSIPTLTIDDVTVTEGNSGSTNAVFTVTLTPSVSSTVTVDYFTANGSATQPGDYTAVNGPLTFSPGQTTRNIIVPVNGDMLVEGDENFFVNLLNPTGAGIGDSQGLAKITDDDVSGGTLTLSASANPVNEGAGKVTITITRTGDTSLPFSVDFSTSDLTAIQRSDYSIQLRTFNFGAGQTTRSLDIFITDDSFVEGNESFNLMLANPTNNFVAGAPNPLTITIADNDAISGPNPIDDPTFFVRQHYIDFLNREPDAPGLAFWINEITSCGANVQCVEVKRINVSASFYLSIEFQETGGFLLRINRAAFGKKSDTASTRLSYMQFMRDAQKVGEGVIVNQGNWQQQLEDNKAAYARQVATSPQFVALHPMAQTAEQFVDALFASATVMPTPAERQAAITAFGSGGGEGRVSALRSVADSDSVRSAEFRPSFVLLEYLGYLRRAPTDPPDADDSGYQFWFAKLNQFNGNFIEAEMVKAFLTSIEYRARFGP